MSMNETKHTAGPWQWIGETLEQVNGEAIFMVEQWAQGDDGPDKETNLANAALIAAAPDLLEALKETLAELEALTDDLPHPRPTAESAVCHRAREAIKASR